MSADSGISFPVAPPANHAPEADVVMSESAPQELPPPSTSSSKQSPSDPSTEVTRSYATVTGSNASTSAAIILPESFDFVIPTNGNKVPEENGVNIRTAGTRGRLNDYVTAVINSGVPGAQISDASRYKGMICLYFRGRAWAQELIEKGLMFEDTRLEVYPVTVSSRRVVISDVPPFCPDFVITSILNAYGNVQGLVKTLPATVTHPDLRSVRSFRRAADVIFPNIDTFKSLPPKVSAKLNEGQYTFLLNAPLKCILCKIEGHQASACPSVATPSTDIDVALSVSATAEVPQAAVVSEPKASNPVAAGVEASGGVFKLPGKRPKKRLAPSSATTPNKKPNDTPLRAIPKKYFYDTATEIWNDDKGVFSPLLSYEKVGAFAAKALTLDSGNRMALCDKVAADDTDLYTLARQVMVFAYSVPDIEKLPMRERKNERNRLYKLSAFMKDYIGRNTTDAETDSEVESMT